ncbi:hypothetical protein [Mycobacteroides franklinii]|uniref:hypothetical protein n=1 Tax=Mycobacteroides franklinii TaxID=948102 RepID=UPI000992CAEC|nr:hypothetical protein [Mycobacteroides franklinii]
MSDPAVEAAQRAYGAMGAEATIWDEAVTAAREALEPIREWHQKKSQWLDCRYSSEALMLKAQLAEIAPLIFTSEELER